MRSYLSLIPISAKVHRRQNRMTLLCIVFAVFLVTAVFSMAEMGARMEYTRLVGKHGNLSISDLLGSYMGQTLLSTACVLFLLILIAGVLMISSSMNSTVVQRTQFFGMMRCIGMSKQQIVRFVRLEALNWCKIAVPIGLMMGIATTWGLCAALRFLVGEEFSYIPLFGISIIGIVCGTVLQITRKKAKNKIVAWIMGVSRYSTLSTMEYPSPGRENIFSTIAEPAREIPTICKKLGASPASAWGSA